VKLSAHSAGHPGNVHMITGSALTPVLESVAALPAYLPTAGRQGGASSPLARDRLRPDDQLNLISRMKAPLRDESNRFNGGGDLRSLKTDFHIR
jgi:hypothetical protein